MKSKTRQVMKLIKKATSYIIGVSILTSVTSCATIVHGPNQKIGISSNPSHANVWVDRNFVGNTPIIVEMTRNNDHIATIQLEGYQPYEIAFTRTVSGWMFGNIVIGGFLGIAIDAITGSMYRLTPDQVQAQFYSYPSANSRSQSVPFIAIVLEPNPSWEKIGSLVAVN